ncbi:MAG: 2-iminoacetate synthase ThiH [Bacteroidales bacterium]|nr:2-iminoacetate synthase ThiH [Bacteroidales bacterium]
MFSEEIEKYSWKSISSQIYSKTEYDVERALSKDKIDIDDFMALISPAAEKYIEPMAQQSQLYTQERFGKTIQMYIPLYLTNSCTNHCVYCGFQHNNPIKRVILTPEEIEEECKAIKALAPFDNILLVTGENARDAGVEYLNEAIKIARKYFTNISIEVMPMKSEEYSLLARSGLNGVVCFQETYNKSRYKVYHPKGMKSNFEWRLNGFDRMGKAKLHKIGLGVLIGLEDWRTDVTMMAIHLTYLKKHYWQTKYSVNFPRIRPSKGGFQPNVVMSNKQLAQLIFAYRIFDKDLDISISTREEVKFRDNILSLGATSFSAGSKTEPGGYKTHPQALEQFEVSDQRTPSEVEMSIRARGYEVVWKDWDKVFDTI